MTVAEAVNRYLALRLSEGMTENSDTYRHVSLHLLDRFSHSYSSVQLSDLQPDHIRKWAACLVNPDNGQPMSALTKRHHLVTVKTFFKRAAAEGWVWRDPSLPVVLPQVEQDDVNLLPVADAFRFFAANRGHRAIGRIALEAFGGLRYSSAARLQADDLKWEREGIEMPASQHKSRKRKFRQGQPANCWEWLRHAPPDCWRLTVRQYASEKTEMHVIAGLRPMVLKSDEDRQRAKALANVWRHSFASYLLARTKAYGPVSYLMQHSKASTTEGYEGRADERDARLYFAITPTSVLLSWPDFVTANRIPPPNP